MFDAFMPHGYCMMWQPELLWLHVLSDAGIVIAYYSIPIALFMLVKHKKELPFSHLFILFGTFILACGTTHLFSMITIWEPWYWVEGAMKAVTAVISLVTVAVLLPLLPQTLDLPTPAELEEADALLTDEIEQRRALEGELSAKDDQLTYLADRLLTAQEDERRRMARDLHDESGQSLSLIQMELTMLLQQEGLAEEIRSQIGDWGERLEALHESLRGLSHRLHPAIVDIVGLRGGIESLCEAIPNCKINLAADIDSLVPSMSLDVYRTIQECVANIAKHAQAESVEVSVDVSAERVVVSIVDDGVGFDTTGADSGLGLIGIQERALSRRGSFVLDSRPGQGTRVVVELPRKRDGGGIRR